MFPVLRKRSQSANSLHQADGKPGSGQWRLYSSQLGARVTDILPHNWSIRAARSNLGKTRP
ncbi:hypothetical protein Gain_0221_002 [Komagataeibacter intermedius TF2]|nr:hypothetical protein Gain_0221_002 [Komagataeibacter intermedius TF2]